MAPFAVSVKIPRPAALFAIAASCVLLTTGAVFLRGRAVRADAAREWPFRSVVRPDGFDVAFASTSGDGVAVCAGEARENAADALRSALAAAGFTAVSPAADETGAAIYVNGGRVAFTSVSPRDGGGCVWLLLIRKFGK